MKNGGLKTFEEMEVWRTAQDLAVLVYQDFAKVKDFSFCDQIKRAAVSVSNNIAEGSERTTPVEFSRFLDIAKGSVGQVRSMYRLPAKLGFMSETLCEERCAKCVNIAKQLGGFTKFLRTK